MTFSLFNEAFSRKTQKLIIMSSLLIRDFNSCMNVLFTAFLYINLENTLKNTSISSFISFIIFTAFTHFHMKFSIFHEFFINAINIKLSHMKTTLSNDIINIEMLKKKHESYMIQSFNVDSCKEKSLTRTTWNININKSNAYDFNSRKNKQLKQK